MLTDRQKSMFFLYYLDMYRIYLSAADKEDLPFFKENLSCQLLGKTSHNKECVV